MNFDLNCATSISLILALKAMACEATVASKRPQRPLLTSNLSYLTLRTHVPMSLRTLNECHNSQKVGIIHKSVHCTNKIKHRTPESVPRVLAE